MSNICINAKELREILTGIRKIVPKNSPEFRRLNIDIGKQLHVLASDGSSFLSHRLDLSEGLPNSTRSFLVSFDDLADFGRGLPARQGIQLEVRESRMTFRTAGRILHSLLIDHKKPFPQTPRVRGTAQQVCPEDRNAILRALNCASTDHTRHVLQGVFLDGEGGSPQVVGTDGRCLYHEAISDLKISNSIILPASPLLHWKGFDADWNLKIESAVKTPPLIQLKVGSWTLTTPAIEGNYPNWRQILPDRQQLKSKFTLGSNDLPILKGLTGESIGLVSNDNRITFVSHEKENGKWIHHPTRTSMGSGPDCWIFLNPKFVSRAINAGLVQAHVGDSCDPCLFIGQDRALVVMPMRVSGFPESPPKPKKQPKAITPVKLKPMRTNTAPPSNNTPSQAALESLRTLKGQLRENIGLVETAIRQFKEAEANQRATQKDLKTIRGTLKSLKSVAFPN